MYRRGYSTGTVDEDNKEVEEEDDYGPSLGNGPYNTAVFVENYFQKIKKLDVDTYFNAIDNVIVDQDTVNYKTRESSKGVNSDTSIVNCVDGSVAYDKFKELFICDSLDEVNVCALKLMDLLCLGKLDNGATASAENYKYRNEIWFNKKQNNPQKQEVADGIEDLCIQRDILILVRCKRGSAETVE